MVSRALREKNLIWFKQSNRYLVCDTVIHSILEDLENGISSEALIKTIAKESELELKAIQDIVTNVIELKATYLNPLEVIPQYTPKHIPETYKIERFFKVDDTVFKVSYLSELETSYLDLKFEHLNIPSSKSFDYHFKVFNEADITYLIVNDRVINGWAYKDIHYFLGKFGMELIQGIYNKHEEEWMGVFHGSAISNQNGCALLLGDSGNGKSTALALLQAAGFHCIADDFIPIAAQDQLVYPLPAAISVKTTSVPYLLPLYPELKDTQEYHLKRLDKHVRYLKPKNFSTNHKRPAKALIFIKYKAESDLIVNEIPEDEALEQLIPDSWISSLETNAVAFMNWFSKLKYYQLTYSDNAKMIACVNNICNS
jgi:hypothetical protein